MACAAAPAAPTAPVALGAMFDGEPDPSVKLAAPKLYGKASISLPEGWEARGGWESVDHVAKSDGSAGIVLLRLDISDALLDANIAAWVKVPFSTTKVKWEPREDGKLGRAHLDAKVAKGTGKIAKDDAEFWHVATASAGKKYGLVLVAGVKNGADDKTRRELVAAMRSVEWK